MEIKAIIGTILTMIGIILIYDARSIIKKTFGSSDQNSATLIAKILGFILSIVGGLLILI